MMRKMQKDLIEHVNTRSQFGSPLADFGIIQEKFAIIAMDTYANEALAYMTTGLIDQEGSPSCEVEAACCKVFGSEKSFMAINEAIQVMGGMGFMKDYPYERLMRDCRILSIFEGTNEILRLMIALTGMKAAGERLKSVGKLVKNPLADPGALLHELSGRTIGRYTSKPALTGVHPSLARSGEKVQAGTVQLGDMVEHLLKKHGKDVVHEQQMLKRVADMTIDLYAMTASLSRASKALSEGSPSAEHERQLAAGFCNVASVRVQRNAHEIQNSSKHDAALSTIAKEMFAEGNYIAQHPIGV